MNSSLVWLRDDLRLADNPALDAAVRRGPTTVLYLLDEESSGIRPLGGAARWWLHYSLAALARDLGERGGSLLLRRGAAGDVVPSVARESAADAVFWNRRYAAAERNIDADLKLSLRAAGLEVSSFQANLLFEPWDVTTGSGTPFKVFTPFWRACLNSPPPRPPISAPERIDAAPALAGDALEDWGLLPRSPDWAGGLAAQWTPGETAAQERLENFVQSTAAGYDHGRNVPGTDGTSRLSPRLRFGELSPFQVWNALGGALGAGIPIFRSELGWREFCWQLLYFNPDLATANYRRDFDAFEWQASSAAELAAWRQGRTGYPLVDAGMRQLWQTGWMHNRVRMVTASFLVKNLLTDWRVGEAWFWDTLVDADPANNAANWQWVAGSGADASPYFRIFNPVTQSRKFDGSGTYLRQYLPELAGLDDKSIHEPHQRRNTDPPAASVYPAPLVELGPSRQRALDAYARLRESLG